MKAGVRDVSAGRPPVTADVSASVVAGTLADRHLPVCSIGYRRALAQTASPRRIASRRKRQPRCRRHCRQADRGGDSRVHLLGDQWPDDQRRASATRWRATACSSAASRRHPFGTPAASIVAGTLRAMVWPSPARSNSYPYVVFVGWIFTGSARRVRCAGRGPTPIGFRVRCIPGRRCCSIVAAVALILTTSRRSLTTRRRHQCGPSGTAGVRCLAGQRGSPRGVSEFR